MVLVVSVWASVTDGATGLAGEGDMKARATSTTTISAPRPPATR